MIHLPPASTPFSVLSQSPGWFPDRAFAQHILFGVITAETITDIWREREQRISVILCYDRMPRVYVDAT